MRLRGEAAREGGARDLVVEVRRPPRQLLTSHQGGPVKSIG